MLALALLAAAPAELDLPRFDAIDVVGGGYVILKQGPVQRVRLLQGNTTISRIGVERQGRNGRRLVVEPCERRCPDRYKLVVEVTAPTVSAVAVRGGGVIEAANRGAASRAIAASVSGGGKIDLRSLEGREMAASVRGGGVILANVRGSLAASVMGGGAIRYWGNPQVSRSVMGGGAVTRGD